MAETRRLRNLGAQMFVVQGIWRGDHDGLHPRRACEKNAYALEFLKRFGVPDGI
jgi:hypothetical protein